jgi:hypothetical protein
MTERNAYGDTFNAWVRKVNTELVEICGLDTDSLADFPSADLWADDNTPAEAARVCLEDWNDTPVAFFV